MCIMVMRVHSGNLQIHNHVHYGNKGSFGQLTDSYSCALWQWGFIRVTYRFILMCIMEMIAQLGNKFICMIMSVHFGNERVRDSDEGWSFLGTHVYDNEENIDSNFKQRHTALYFDHCCFVGWGIRSAGFFLSQQVVFLDYPLKCHKCIHDIKIDTCKLY